MIQDPYVLVVDDDDAILDTIREVLEDEGYRVQTLSDGNAVLRHIHADPPGMVLLDLRMPHIDGSQIYRELQCDRIAAQVPVVIVTADGQGAEQASDLGATDYLAKPFDIDVLFACVERVMRPRLGTVL